MNALMRPAIDVLVVVPLAVCVFGLRFACNSSDVKSLLREIRSKEEQQKLHQATLDRVQDRQEVVRELIAQRCSLKEALARFQELDHEWPDYVTDTPKRDGGILSDEERNYQYILAIAKDLLKNRREEAAVVLRRLEKEYQQLRAGRKMPSAMPTKRIEASR
jgi:hypothetical protein